jgi:hypothetical protein
MKKLLFLGTVFLTIMVSTVSLLLADPPFSPGEKIRYGINAAGFPVGKQLIHLQKMVNYDGQPAFHLYGESRTSGLVGLLYRLDDKWDVYMNRETLLPLRVEKDMKEGKKEGYFTYDIDQENRTVAIVKNRGESNKLVEAENTVLDLFSLIYFYRNNPDLFDEPYTFDFLEPNDVQTVTFEKKGTRDIELPYLSRHAKIPAVRIKQVGGIGIEIFVSDDELRLPLRMLVPSKLPKDRQLNVEFILEQYDPGREQKGDIPRVYRRLSF